MDVESILDLVGSERLIDPFDVVDMVSEKSRDEVQPHDHEVWNVKGFTAARLHARNMALKRWRPQPKCSSYVKQKLDQHNIDSAVRDGDIIDDLTVKKAKLIRGRGRFQAWTASAMLRACFGKRRISYQ